MAITTRAARGAGRWMLCGAAMLALAGGAGCDELKRGAAGGKSATARRPDYTPPAGASPAAPAASQPSAFQLVDSTAAPRDATGAAPMYAAPSSSSSPTDATRAPAHGGDPASGQTPRTSPTPQSQVRLYAATALPQTGPTGILMSFSVDYQFTSGGPRTGATYAWVIERGGGPPAVLTGRLEQRGTLQTFIIGWRPEERPFSCHLLELYPDGARRQLGPKKDFSVAGAF